MLAALVAVAAAVLTALQVWPGKLPLRVGMTRLEAEAVLGGPAGVFRGNDVHGTPHSEKEYEPDWLGNKRRVRVLLDDDKVIGWEETFTPGPSPLVQQVKKWLGL
jgi:hypothetical protein